MTTDTDKRPIVWSYGGGTSAAIAGVSTLREIAPARSDRYGRHKPRKYKPHGIICRTFVEPDLNKIGLTVTIVPHSYAYHDILKGKKEAVLIPAFTTQNGSIGKLPTFCSNEWKQRPIRRYLREQGIETCDLWLGSAWMK